MTLILVPLRCESEITACCDLWLEASIEGHSFIPEAFWRDRYAVMRRVYVPNVAVTLAYCDDKLAGFSALSGDSLAALFVSPEFWRQGIGSALLRHCMSGRRFLRLSVYAENTQAIGFYRRAGFMQTGVGTCPHTGSSELSMEWRRSGE